MVLWVVVAVLFGWFGVIAFVIITQPFRALKFTTYLVLPILGIMVIFGLMGEMLKVGWLQSAPDVLLIPMLVLYYISLAIGAVYGYLKHEESVYLLAMISIAIWIVGFLLGSFLTFSRPVMMGINLFLLAALLVLHILQYSHTKKWEMRLTKAARKAKTA
jgi:hypothetical protein